MIKRTNRNFKLVNERLSGDDQFISIGDFNIFVCVIIFQIGLTVIDTHTLAENLSDSNFFDFYIWARHMFSFRFVQIVRINCLKLPKLFVS